MASVSSAGSAAAGVELPLWSAVSLAWRSMRSRACLTASSSRASRRASSSMSFIISSSSVPRTRRGPPQPESAAFFATAGGVLPSSQRSRSRVTVSIPRSGTSVAVCDAGQRSLASNGSTKSAGTGGATNVGRLSSFFSGAGGSSGIGGSTGCVMSLRCSVSPVSETSLTRKSVKLRVGHECQQGPPSSRQGYAGPHRRARREDERDGPLLDDAVKRVALAADIL